MAWVWTTLKNHSRTLIIENLQFSCHAFCRKFYRRFSILNFNLNHPMKIKKFGLPKSRRKRNIITNNNHSDQPLLYRTNPTYAMRVGFAKSLSALLLIYLFLGVNSCLEATVEDLNLRSNNHLVLLD